MDRQLIKNTLREIIHLTPARQAEVCYRVNISDHSANQIAVRMEPTLDYLTWTRIGDKNRTMLYDSMVFHTGLATGNITAWLDRQNISYAVTQHLPDDPEVQCVETSHTMGNNIKYIVHELGAWIELQRVRSVGVFANYQYDSTKCHRDCTFILKAVAQDLDHLSNDHVVNCLYEYFDKAGRPLVRQSVEVEAYKFLRTLIVDSVLTHTAPDNSYQSHTPRSPLQLAVEPEGRQHVDYLLGVIIDVLGKGPGAIPAPLNSVPRTQDYVEVIVNV
jgi:hypothetical protein